MGKGRYRKKWIPETAYNGALTTYTVHVKDSRSFRLGRRIRRCSQREYDKVVHGGKLIADLKVVAYC